MLKRWKVLENGDAVGLPTYYYFDGWNLVQEGSNAATADRLYVHGNRIDEIVASWAGGEWMYHHYDARGHCILLTSASSGGIREQYDYDAFGYPYFYNSVGGKLAPSAQWGNRFLFTGREWLKDMKLYDFRARMYQPELGRFLQPDPKEFAAGDYNLYRYCHNDPVNQNDPTGLAPVVIDESSDAAAQQANLGNFQATQGTSFWSKEFGTAVNRDSSGHLTLNGPISNTAYQVYVKMVSEVPFGRFVSDRTILVTHSHTDLASSDTGSHLSTGDIFAANVSGKPVYVITPDGQQDRYRPSDKGAVKERFNDPGVIERLINGKWHPLPGANPDIRDKMKVPTRYWK